MQDHKRIERLMMFVELAQQLNFSRAASVLGHFKKLFIRTDKASGNRTANPTSHTHHAQRATDARR